MTQYYQQKPMLQQAKLSNGLTILGEHRPSAQSVAFGFFVHTGARDENHACESGVSHFLEHMVFKGTDQLPAETVNRLFDDLGCNYNASTGEEVTTFYAAVLPEYFETVFPLQAAILFPSLREDDFTTEKQVILEEIAEYADQPVYVAYDHVMQLHFREHPLGQPILGTPQSIQSLTAEQMKTYHREHYLAGNIALVIAGNFDWNQILELASKECGHWPAGETAHPCRCAAPAAQTVVIPKPALQQQHIMSISPAPDSCHRLRYAAEMVSIIVGDDSNSRLYWELVDPGLTDIAEISYSDYQGCGTWLTYLCCDPEVAEENWQAVRKVLDELKTKPITVEEMEQARNLLATRLVSRGEQPMHRMLAIGQNWHSRMEYRSLDDELAALDQVTMDDLQNVIREFPLLLTSTVSVGPNTAIL
ncbi:M16 family metallopeptidase [Planctopirus hydrillae]|nr:pitrilysin family protein [Planctopirus hydrillae]